jgi:CBS-domain-containing membrane protein
MTHRAVYSVSAGPDRIHIVFEAYGSVVGIVRETDCLAALVKVDYGPCLNVPVRVI